MTRGPYIRRADLDERLAAAPVRNGRPLTQRAVAALVRCNYVTIQNIERRAMAKFRRRAPHLAEALERGGLYG